MFPMIGGKHSISVEDYVQNLQQEMTKAHEVARNKLKTSLKRMKRNYDLRILTRTYEKGDAVYVLDTATIKGKCKKSTAPWKGPGVIEKKISAFIYRVKMKNSIFVTNHDRLKPCLDRQLPKWIQDWEKDQNCDNASSADKLYCLCR
jgi:hypothetical protein